ncbi:AraC family transcriptional regulator [Burkholderiaceae bacterium DAT-1]|nr:AraC family transcriptional regulator [Burkholderiaceae bacterium DAT-1]
MKHPRVTAPFAQPLIDTCQRLGLDWRAGLTEVGIHVTQPVIADDMSVESYLQLLQWGEQASACDDFGLQVGQSVKLASYTVYGMIMMACSSVGEALQAVMRYEGLAHDLGLSQLRVEGDLAGYYWRSPWSDRTPALASSIFAGIMVSARWLLGPDIKPVAMQFSFAAPLDTAPWEAFFGCLVTFGADDHVAWFDAALLDHPLPNADPAFYTMLTGHADHQLAARQAAAADGEDDLIDTVRKHLMRLLPTGLPKIDVIARELNVSSRTLQRRLSGAGWTFQRLLDDTLQALAKQYLADPAMRMTDIAFLLGYSEQSAFNHAFREWTGCSPRQWREQNGV